MNTSLIPFGSIIDYDGVLYVALDRGSAIKGARLDLLMPTHEECVKYGRREASRVTVYIPGYPSLMIGEIREVFGTSAGL